jgi:nucleotide-binding universal stress UspA family protein
MAGLGTNTFRLLHVLTNMLENKKYIGQKMEATAGKLRSWGYSVETQILEGLPAKVISQAAAEEGIDYIYIPGRSNNILYRSLLGSTAKEVVRLAERPTLVHKKYPALTRFMYEEKLQDPLQLRKKFLRSVVFATDFGSAAERAIPYVQEIAQHAQKAVVLHAGERAGDPTSEAKRLREVEVKLASVEEKINLNYNSVETQARVGFPGRIIKKYSEKNVDLIVIGRFNLSPYAGIMGSTAEYATANVNCSILLIP